MITNPGSSLANWRKPKGKSAMLDKQTLQLAAVFLQNFPPMPGDQMQALIEQPMKVREILWRYLPCYPIFWTGVLGTGPKDKAELDQACLDRLMLMTPLVEKLISRYVFLIRAAQPQATINIVAPTIADLGFVHNSGVDYFSACQQGRAMSYEDVTPEIALLMFLNIEYSKIQFGQTIFFCMQCVYQQGLAGHYIFAIMNKSGKRHLACKNVREVLCRPTDRLAFVTRKQL